MVICLLGIRPLFSYYIEKACGRPDQLIWYNQQVLPHLYKTPTHKKANPVKSWLFSISSYIFSNSNCVPGGIWLHTSSLMFRQPETVAVMLRSELTT